MSENRFVIVGTAGHIDHGKTALVAALTGKNTDRLREEQERGISIDIDFAPLPFPDGTLIGMVDVPGHERFIRNMVAGAAGIDAALLVIDVNEGMKPQTYEHISILQLLGVRQGVVALTKADLAEPDWLEIAQDIIREELADTVFAAAPLVVTSVKSGTGLDELRDALHQLAATTQGRDATGAFRLPIDKVFSIPGIGTVVSGTVWRGQVQPTDVLEVLPSRTAIRVRGIQTHGRAAQEAQAGQRSALNIVGLDKDQLWRGKVLAARGTLTETRLLDVKVQVLEKLDRGLFHRDRVHVHLGTAEVVGRVLLLEVDELLPGQTSLAQLTLEKPLACEATDHFVLRSFSPVLTLGGGRVIDPAPGRLHRRKRAAVLEGIAARDTDSPLQRLLVAAKGGTVWTKQSVTRELGVTEDEAGDLLLSGADQGLLMALPSGYVGAALIPELLGQLEHTLQIAHQKRRFEAVVPRSLLANAIAKTFTSRDLDWLLEEGQKLGMWVHETGGIRAAQWQVTLTADEEQMLSQLLMAAQEQGLNYAAEDELAKRFPNRDRIAKALLRYAVATGKLVEVESGVLVHSAVLGRAYEQIAELFRREGPFTAARARDELGTGRKNTITLLEYLDGLKVTVRHGDTRTLQDGAALPVRL